MTFKKEVSLDKGELNVSNLPDYPYLRMGGETPN